MLGVIPEAVPNWLFQLFLIYDYDMPRVVQTDILCRRALEVTVVGNGARLVKALR